jgi:predicted nucleotidyltransferase
MKPLRLGFPTQLHQQVAELVRDSISAETAVDTVLVVNSCARGQATPESDLDMAILMPPTTTADAVLALEEHWRNYLEGQALVKEFKQAGRFALLHLDFFNGQFTPTVWEEGAGGPDGFELEVGNRLAYSAPLGEAGPYLKQLQAQWLPYYADDLRQQRLGMVRDACLYDLAHVPMYVGRGLHFQAFDRLYKGFQEFLQAVFIARRTYPLAYNKWIREQVEVWLGEPELYQALPSILSVSNFESAELTEKAEVLQSLLERWAQP